jgi:hypothetical protein
VECDSSEIHAIRGAGVQRIGIAHENDCAFLAAVRCERAEQWARQNGYPIRVEAVDTAGAA